MRKPWGFTLIEMMIVVAMVAILAAIAVPSYQEQIRKARRTDARVPLLELAGKLEKYAYVNNGTYVGATVVALMGSANSPEGYYTLSLDAATATSFTVSATPVAGKSQAKDDLCMTFTLNAAGGKEAKSASAADTSKECWKS